MNSLKIILVLVLVVVAIVSSLWVGGFIADDVASETMRKSTGIILIIGTISALVFVLIGKPKKSENKSDSTGYGPKF